MVAKKLANLLRPSRVAHAHCDLPCGVYDPAQARIEAESVKACQQKFQDSDDPVFKERAVSIKEERADLVKHHLWVLWTDYFKPDHVAKFPQLHDTFRRGQEDRGPRAGPEAPGRHRRDRQDLLGVQEVVRSPDQLPSFASKEPGHLRAPSTFSPNLNCTRLRTRGPARPPTRRAA